MDIGSLQINFEEIPKDLDNDNEENEILKLKLKDAQDCIKKIKDYIDISRVKRTELVK